MKAVVLDEPGGGPDSFRVDPDFPDPIPGPSEVVVRVGACAVNYLDIWVRRGIDRTDVPFPHVSGSDVAGVVASGEGAGRRVMIHPGLSCGRCRACTSGNDSRCPDFDILGLGSQGGYAELVAVPERNLFDVPEGWTNAEAAAFPLTFVTAWHGLSGVAGPTTDVLVWGASGGVGVAAVQVARALGAQVAAATTSESKRDRLRRVTDARVYVGSADEVADQVLGSMGGADVVVDPLGAGVWDATRRVLRKGGTVLSVGDTAGDTIEVNLTWLLVGERRLSGVYLGGLGDFREVHAAARRGELRPVVDSVLPVDEAGRAQTMLEERAQVGKVVLEVA
jgi:NADPH:quinone reductase-like Zn-dependent oxidoreductase